MVALALEGEVRGLLHAWHVHHAALAHHCGARCRTWYGGLSPRVQTKILGDWEFCLRAVHLLVWGRESCGRGVVLGGLRLVERHAVRHVAVLLLHRLLRLVDVRALLLLLGVGLRSLGHCVSLCQCLRALRLLLLLLVRHVVLRHGRLRGLLLILLLLLLLLILRLLLLLLWHSVLLRLLLRHRRALLLLLLGHVVLWKLLLGLSGALRSSMCLHILRRALLRLRLLRRHLLLLYGRTCLRRWCLRLLGELRLRRGVLLLHLGITLTLTGVCLRLLRGRPLHGLCLSAIYLWVCHRMTTGLLARLLSRLILLLRIPLLLLVVQCLVLFVLCLQGCDLARGLGKHIPRAVQPVLHVFGEILATVLESLKTRNLSARTLSLQNAGTKALLVGELVRLELLCIGRVGFRKYYNLLNHRFDLCLQLSVWILLPSLLLNLRRLLLGLWPLLLLRWLLLLELLRLLHRLCILLSLYATLLHALHLSCLSLSLGSSLWRLLTLLRRLTLLGCGSASRSSSSPNLCHDSGAGVDNLVSRLIARLTTLGVVVMLVP